MEAAIIIVCLLLSAFFSGMEIAYVSSNKIFLGVESKQSAFLSKVLTRLTQNPARFITSMLVGNTIALVIYSYYMGSITLRIMAPDLALIYKVILQIVLSSVLMLLTAQFLPKVFFQIYSNTLIKFFAIPAYAFYYIFHWISKFAISIADFILIKILRTKGEKQQSFFSKIELGSYITEQMNGVAGQEEVDSEIQIFQNALDFSDLKARDVMTPRTEIAALEMNESVEKLRELFIETDYSKIIIYKDSLDNIVGYVHSFDLFKKPESIEAVMIPIEHAPGTIFIKELLNILTRKRRSMSVVLDEYGGTAGVITIEDIIEELFGEIDDEHDEEEELTEMEMGNGAYLFSARLDVEYVNDKYGLSIPESDSYATLGGFIVDTTNEIPKPGETLQCGEFEIFIEQASNKKIELIRIGPIRQN